MTRKNAELWHVDVQMAIEVLFHEAVVRQAYYDSENVLTWSAGMTNATGHRVERYIRNPQPMQHCINIYVWALERYADHVRKAFKGIKLTREQFTAALSFQWNTGGIDRARWVVHFRNGELGKARAAFMNWRSPPSIIERRKKERDLFFDAKWSSDGTTTEYTEVNQKTLVPIWSSAKRVDIRKEIGRALMTRNLEASVVLDQNPEPDRIPKGPTLSPTETFQKSIKDLDLKVTGPRSLEQLKELKVPEVNLPKVTTPQLGTVSLLLVAIGTVLATTWEWIRNLPCNVLNIFCGG